MREHFHRARPFLRNSCCSFFHRRCGTRESNRPALARRFALELAGNSPITLLWALELTNVPTFMDGIPAANNHYPRKITNRIRGLGLGTSTKYNL